MPHFVEICGTDICGQKKKQQKTDESAKKGKQ